MSKRRRQTYIGCSLGERAGRLRLRFRWQGEPHSVATGLTDTPENRRALWPLAKKVGAVIKAGEDPTAVLMKSIVRRPVEPVDPATLVSVRRSRLMPTPGSRSRRHPSCAGRRPVIIAGMW
jgi:hypothetical protein